MNNLKKEYLEKIIPKFFKKFNYKNIHQIPKLVKIQINSGLGLNAQNKVFLQRSIEEMRLISGQHPALTKAKKSIANFKIRKEMPLGLVVTLRREKMYAFLDKLIKIVLPRIRDFRGLNLTKFDAHGNYNFGISEQFIFPEIDFDNIDPRRGFNITIVTTATSLSESIFLLENLGMPFTKIKEEI